MTADRKLTLVKTILRNETYMQDSGLYQRLEAALNKVSLETLSQLDVLISCKMAEAEQRGREKNPADR
jgi:hypothetical protein